jgi:hypothetical protein
MLAIHPQSNPKINLSSRKKIIMAAGWKSPRRCIDASCPSINQTRKAITRQGKREKWTRDVNLLEEGADMLAVYRSIKPKNQAFIKENEKWSQDGNLLKGDRC